LIRPLDRAQSFTVVFGARFPWIAYGINMVEEEIWSRQTGKTAEKDQNFWSDRWMALKVLLYFSKAIFLEVPMECLLVEEEVLSPQIEITAEMGHNFWSDRWIALTVLQ